MGKPGTRGGGFRPGGAADLRVKARAAKLMLPGKDDPDRVARLREFADTTSDPALRKVALDELALIEKLK